MKNKVRKDIHIISKRIWRALSTVVKCTDSNIGVCSKGLGKYLKYIKGVDFYFTKIDETVEPLNGKSRMIGGRIIYDETTPRHCSILLNTMVFDNVRYSKKKKLGIIRHELGHYYEEIINNNRTEFAAERYE